MTSQDIVFRRLMNQQLVGEVFTDPAGLLQWMGCIRAEDLTGAKWAIGHRVAGSTDKTIGQAFNQGHILRTHLLQPAWHFVSAADIRWMLTLTAPKLKAFNKNIYHSLGIDPAVLKKSKRIIVRALERGQMTRSQLGQMLNKERIHVDDLRTGWILMDAELDGLICSGGVEGRQVCYALLDQRAPPPEPQRDREEHIAELARRYFLSRGPATVDDFADWSGLRPADVQTGMELNKQWMDHAVIEGQVYWFDGAGPSLDGGGSLFLLPTQDEWTIAYKGNGIFKPIVIVDGRMAGTWHAVPGRDGITLEVVSPAGIGPALREALRQEAERYSVFLGRRLLVS